MSIVQLTEYSTLTLDGLAKEALMNLVPKTEGQYLSEILESLKGINEHLERMRKIGEVVIVPPTEPEKPYEITWREDLQK